MAGFLRHGLAVLPRCSSAGRTWLQLHTSARRASESMKKLKAAQITLMKRGKEQGLSDEEKALSKVHPSTPLVLP